MSCGRSRRLIAGRVGRRERQHRGDNRASAPHGLDLKPPAERRRPVRQPDEAVPRGVRPPDAVIANLHDERAFLDPRLYVGSCGLRVLHDVGECLGDDEVGARLDLRGKSLTSDLAVNGQVETREDRLYASPETVMRQDRRKDPVGRARGARRYPARPAPAPRRPATSRRRLSRGVPAARASA